MLDGTNRNRNPEAESSEDLAAGCEKSDGHEVTPVCGVASCPGCSDCMDHQCEPMAHSFGTFGLV